MIFSQFAGGLLTLAVLGFSYSSACSKGDIEACKAPLEVMTKPGITPLTQDCEAVENAMECIANLKKECNNEIIDNSLIDEEMYELVENISRCKGEQLVRNKRGLLKKKKTGSSKKVPKVKPPINGKVPKVKPPINGKGRKVLWKIRHKGREALWKIGRNSFTSCTSMGITACGRDTLATPGTIINTPDKCSLLMEALGCLDEAASQCSFKMSFAVLIAKAALGRLDTGYCQEQEPDSDTNSLGSCTHEKLQECKVKIVKSDDTKANCLAAGKSQQCFEDADKDCNSASMLRKIGKERVLINKYIEFCTSTNGNEALQPTVISFLASVIFVVRYVL